MSAAAVQWPEGLPKSTNNAFNWHSESLPQAAPMTSEEKNRIQTRERMARTRAIQKATRVNPNAGHAINSQADNDKTAKIVGRRNEARSQ